MESLEEIASEVASRLAELGQTLAVAESCTGGKVADALTDNPGISRYFLLGVVSYSDGAKTGVLSVPMEILEEHGAVSGKVAAAMAEGVLRKAGSAVAVAVTGVAGPTAPEGVPVGRVFTAVAGEGGDISVREHNCQGDRASVKKEAAARAMEHLLGVLRG